jgi:hypothetical protein
MGTEYEQPTDEDIDACLVVCHERGDDSQFPGMTYEQGVMYAIRWMRGEDIHPLAE